MATTSVDVIGGVDTHADTHHAAVIDLTGRHLADAKFPTTPAGYAALAAFLTAFGTVVRVGVEGTGSYGAALTRHLRRAGLEVVEVIRPNRQLRRMRGKSDPIDAYAAATTALAADEHPAPKATTGTTEALRYLMVARRSAVKARTAAQVQIKSLLVTAPSHIRERFRRISDKALIEGLARMRPDKTDDVLGPIVLALKMLARRHQQHTEQITELDSVLAPLVTQTNPALAAAKGIGPVTAAQLLITAGENPDRLRSEATFAALTGVSPIPASSGKTNRHRLNRGGDRQANAAIHRVALVRMSYEPRTRAYIDKKRAEGMTTKSAIRSLKRAIAREIFTLLTKPSEIPSIDDLRPLREARGITLTTAAKHFNVWPTTISTIERGQRRDDTFATIYRNWLTAA